MKQKKRKHSILLGIVNFIETFLICFVFCVIYYLFTLFFITIINIYIYFFIVICFYILCVFILKKKFNINSIRNNNYLTLDKMFLISKTKYEIFCMFYSKYLYNFIVIKLACKKNKINISFIDMLKLRKIYKAKKKLVK